MIASAPLLSEGPGVRPSAIPSAWQSFVNKNHYSSGQETLNRGCASAWHARPTWRPTMQGMDMGHREESDESEEEYYAWCTYYQIHDNNFDCDL